MAEVRRIDMEELFHAMRVRVNEMLGKPPPPPIDRDEGRNEQGARVVTICATDRVRTKDGAG